MSLEQTQAANQGNASVTSVRVNHRDRNDSILPLATIENVLPFYLKKAHAGQKVCLVTIYHVDTVSPRPVGSQIAVAQDGESFGFITGGCAEAAIVHEALIAIQEQRGRTIRIGSKSPWLDIKLPCGAGIDLHFSVNDCLPVIEAACERILNREPISLAIDTLRDTITLASPGRLARTLDAFESGQIFIRDYFPQSKLVVIGAGPYVGALAGLAKQSEFDVEIWTPEQEVSDGLCKEHRFLERTTKLPSKLFDAFTAAVLLFHEHDWEPTLLQMILKSECFYVGALGSHKTHAQRLAELRKIGIADSQLQRIFGPVGMAIGARTPAEIAVSILAEIIKVSNDESTLGYRNITSPPTTP